MRNIVDCDDSVNHGPITYGEFLKQELIQTLKNRHSGRGRRQTKYRDTDKANIEGPFNHGNFAP